ncbi:bifunctional serine/threonine-protein kinase/formylglycine-generating enzyme family protein [Myxococcota bacterium]|nr:bifunctional serine/threonine-protein kinase/formylglycine-generating enzyme family protein [Myxococcota bacterium]
MAYELEDLGADVFFDGNLKSGADPAKIIRAALERTRVLVVVLAVRPAHTRDPYYQDAEVNAFVQLLRDADEKGEPQRAIVPLYVDQEVPFRDIPLAAHKVVPLALGADRDWRAAAGRLLADHGGARSAGPLSQVESLQRSLADARDRGDATAERRLKHALVDARQLAEQGPPLEAGRSLAEFELVEKVGSGGFAEVWKAWDRATGRHRAVKVLHIGHGANVLTREKFFEGAAVMRELHDLQVVQVYQERREVVLGGAQRAYYVMDYWPGGDLSQRRLETSEAHLDRHAALRCCTQVAECLLAVHARGKLHRDVKPQNVLIDRHGHALLTDFDLVGDVDASRWTKSRMGGTPIYAAPEVEHGTGKPTVAADVWSLTMMIVFCAYGAPLPPEAKLERREFVNELRVSDRLKAVLLRGLEVKPRNRCSVGDIAGALHDELSVDPPLEWQRMARVRPVPARTVAPRRAENDLPRVEPGDTAPGEVVMLEAPQRPAMVHIPAGEFMMGSPEDEPGRYGDERLHRQRLTRPFLIAATPVTQAQYEAVTHANPSKFGGKSNGRHPVEQLSWDDAIQYCNTLSALEGREEAWSKAGDRWVRVPNAEGYTLPTETQWEWACRACTRTAYWSGPAESDLAAVGWYGQNSGGKTHPVGETNRPNPWGLHDMHGLVSEWTADWYADYPEPDSDDYAGPESGVLRVIRGGSWSNLAGDVRAALRVGRRPDIKGRDLGFRVVLPPFRTRA